MKRIFSCVLSIMLIALMLTSITGAAGSTNLILEYKAGTVKKGETVKVSFLIDNNSGFGTIGTKIGFNKGNFELKSVNKTYTPTGTYKDDALPINISAANNNGRVFVQYTPKVLEPNTFTEPITYNGVLAELTFVAKADCTPEFYFVSNELFLDDMDMTDVPYTTRIKKVQVLENLSSEIGTSSSNSVNTSSNVSQNQSLTVNTNASVITPSGTTSIVSYSPPIVLDNDKGDTPNNLLVIGIVLGATAVLIAAAIVVKKLTKK